MVLRELLHVIPVRYIIAKLNNVDKRECNILNIFDAIVNILVKNVSIGQNK